MTNNTRSTLCLVLLLLAMLVLSCTQDTLSPESQNQQPQDFRLADARKHYEGNIKNLCLPQIYLKPIIQTKGNNFFHSLKQIPQWEKYHFWENDWSYIYEVPILYNIPAKAIIGYLTQEGRLSKVNKEVKIQTNLIIQKYKGSGNTYIFLSTVLGYLTDSDKDIDGISPWLWTGDRRNFTGYQFFTNTDGSFRSAFQYSNSKRWNISLSIYNKNEVYDYPSEVFIINFEQNTKSSSDDKYCDVCQIWFDGSEQYCPSCGAWIENLEGIIIRPEPEGPEYCELCGQWIEYCTCDNHSGGDVCPYCHNPNCSGECQNIGGGSNHGGGDPPPDDNIYYTVGGNVSPANSGSISGLATYIAGTNASLRATPAQEYIFAYWSGDLSGSNNPKSITVNEDISVTAHFLLENSECGKLFKTVNNLNDILRYSDKIEIGGIEYGYVRTDKELKEYTGSVGKITLPKHNNTIEVLHTHDCEIHLSKADLCSLYRRYMRGDISNISEFKYISVSPDYIVVLQINNEQQVRNLIESENILTRVDLDNNKYTYELSDYYKQRYISSIQNGENKGVEDYFKDFVNYMNEINSGFSISMYRIDKTSNIISGKLINTSADVDINGCRIF